MSRIKPLPALRLALALLLPLGGVGEVQAATFTVTNLFDSGAGSLRQAVLDANAASGADEVAFAEGLSGTITLTSGEIAISDPLVVHGPGIAVLTVSGNAQSRIFYVEKPSVATPIDVTLSGLTLTQGRGILEHSSLGWAGGAVFANGENLTILDSVISNSTAGLPQDPAAFTCGGNVALLNPADVSGVTLRIVNSLLTGGTSMGITGEAGGNLCVVSAKLVLDRSTLSGGSAESGGGLFGSSLAAGSIIVLSTVSGNQAEIRGGGIASGSSGPVGELTIESSTISGNTISSGGSGGGIAAFQSNLQILDSTISGNQGGDAGGGVESESSRLTFVDSTISSNQARVGGGIFFEGNEPGSLVLRLTTVSNNTASVRGGSLLASTSPDATVVQLDHSILANGAPQDLDGPGAPFPGTLTANYSLIEAPGTVLVVGAHNLIGTDPILGPLAANGGPTLTHRPLAGSPVIDAGDPAIPSPPATDQRGFARIVGPAIDLGSVEGGAQVVEVPTVSELGLLALWALLLAAGVVRMRATRAAH